MVQKPKPKYVKLQDPADVLAYVQRLVNRLRRKGLEIDPNYLGKIIYLLNTWLSAYKTNLESIEIKQLREEVTELKRKTEVKDGNPIRIEQNQGRY